MVFSHMLPVNDGETLFRKLVLNLAMTLEVDYVFIGEVNPQNVRIIRTIAFCDHGSIADNVEYHLAQAAASGSVNLQTTYYFPEGARELYPEDEILSRYRIATFIGHPLLDASGQVLGLLAVMHTRPVTNPGQIQSILQISASRAVAELERRHTEAELRKLSSAIEQTGDSVIITDADGVIEYVNPAFEQITGYSRAEALGRKPNLVRSGQHDEDFYRRLWETIQRGLPFRDVFINRRRDGAAYFEEKTITPLTNAAGRITGYVSTGKDMTERMRAEKALQENNEILERIFASTHFSLVYLDRDFNFIRVNKAYANACGFPPEYFPGKNHFHLYPHAENEAIFRRVVQSGEPFSIFAKPFEFPDHPEWGVTYWDWTLHPLKNAEGNVETLLFILLDVTESKQTEDRAARLGRILERSSNEIYVFDATTLKFTQANQSALKNLGYSTDEMRGLTPLDIKWTFTLEQFRVMAEPLRQGDEDLLTFETEHARKDGSLYPVEVRLQYSAVETPAVFVAVVTDITERRQTQERLNYLAFYDTLTGLPNRLLLLDRLRQAMLECEHRERLVAVMFLDLDRFKLVNDTLGHEAGDLLLKDVAGRLSGCVRPGDTVARLGGDEFTVILANIAHVDDVGRVAQKVINVFSTPFLLAGKEVFVSPSIGITLYPFDDTDPELLLKNADTAMYHAKDSGRNTFRFFTADLNRRAAQRLDLETALRHALDRDEFLLHYQPQVDLTSGRIIGLEALIRWQRPGTGLVPPLDFIPLAEETGLIVPIGEWALRTACAQNQAWQEAGLPPLRMSVNIAARQFQQQNLAEVVIRILEETGLGPHWLMLEITESTVMRDAGAAIETLREIGSLGVGLSVDDFGTGYSSLSYLKRFPLDCLKIDKSFIEDITTNPDDAAIATAIISMAGSLEIKVVAEGVESLAQLDFLRARGCDAMQGYYFSKPLPATALAAMLAKDTRLDVKQISAPAGATRKSGARATRPLPKRSAPVKK